MVDGPLYDELLQAEMWGEYFPEDEPFGDVPESAWRVVGELLPVSAPAFYSDKELRSLMKRGWRRRLSDFMEGARKAFKGTHESLTLCGFFFVVRFCLYYFLMYSAVVACMYAAEMAGMR